MRRTIEKIKERKAITLIALVVTIVVILILAGITVGMVTSDSGILKETKNAKQQAEIDNEKSIVERAKMLAMMRSKNGAITYEIFEPALKDEAGTNPTEVSDVENVIEVLFTDSNRYYEVDKDGNVSEPQEVVKDEYAGDITKGGRCDGSEEKPYEINCIEDLVSFSNLVKGSGIKLENGKAVTITRANAFKNKNVILTRNLNFKSKYSYANSQRTDFGDINGDDTDGNSLMTEMTTGTGFVPIGTFWGNFNGKEHTISKIYINAAEDDKTPKGLFGDARNAYICNLMINGEIKSNWHTGGIVGDAYGSTIENCQNKVDIIGYNMVGGISGIGAKKIENCKNYGTVEITGRDYSASGAGGIEAVASNINDAETYEINNCVNYGKVTGIGFLGGIIATSNGDGSIKNCTNQGTINPSNNNDLAGGIVAWKRNKTLNIISSENKGDIKGTARIGGGIIGSVSGANWEFELNAQIYNCYNTGKIQIDNIAGGIIGEQGTIAAQNYVYIYNSYNLGKTVGKQKGNIVGIIKANTGTDTKTEFLNVYYSLEPAIGTGSLTSGEATLKTEKEIKSQAFVDLLNSNIGTNTDWKKWKLGSDGYPTFVE